MLVTDFEPRGHILELSLAIFSIAPPSLILAIATCLAMFYFMRHKDSLQNDGSSLGIETSSTLSVVQLL